MSVRMKIPKLTMASVSEWSAWMRAASRPESTIKLRTYHLRRFAGDHDGQLWPVTTETMINWLGNPAWSVETRRSMASSLRGLYRWAAATGRIPADPAALLPPSLTRRHLARPAPEEVIEQAVEHATPRVALMLQLAARQGLRRAEIAQIHSSDLFRDLEGWSLRVRGKGGRDRLVPLHDDLADRLRHRPPGWLFPGQDGHLSPPYVGKLMSRALGERWTAHTLRHRFATRTHRAGADVLVLQQLLGHAKTDTTRIYVQISQAELRRAVLEAA